MIRPVREIVQVPTYGPISIVALYKGVDDLGPFEYLQRLASPNIGSDVETTKLARIYSENESRFCDLLARMISQPIDALISPPSGRFELITAYRDAISKYNPGAVDFSPSISRQGGSRSSFGDSIDVLEADLNYTPNGVENDCRRLVVVDDIFATGTTVAAVLRKLHSNGLPGCCEVICACPLWKVSKVPSDEFIQLVEDRLKDLI